MSSLVLLLVVLSLCDCSMLVSPVLFIEEEMVRLLRKDGGRCHGLPFQMAPSSLPLNI